MAIFLRYKYAKKITAGILVAVFVFPLFFLPKEASAVAPNSVQLAVLEAEAAGWKKTLEILEGNLLKATVKREAAKSAAADARLLSGVPISTSGDVVAASPIETEYQALLEGREEARSRLMAVQVDIAKLQAEKEGFWDAVAFGVVKIFLNRLTLNLVEWIRTGYEGRPTFLTNKEAFFQDIRNQATGVFINEMGLNEVMCEPWKFGVTFGLTFQKPYLLKAKCTLKDAQANFKNMSQNFMAAGWQGFLDITVKQENNPYGAFMQAQSEIAVRVGKEQEKQKEDLGHGRGYFSITKKGECAEYDDDTNCVRYAPDKTVTPGSYIADSVSFLGMSSVRQAELADELNESLSVIAGEMIMQAINPNRGLASFDTVTLDAAAAAFAAQTGGRLQDVASGKINEAIAARNTKNSSLALIPSVYQIYKDLIGVDLITYPGSIESITIDDIAAGSSCLGRLLATAQAGDDVPGVSQIRGEITDGLAALGSVAPLASSIPTDITQITAAETTLNGWHAQLTATTPPPPADLEVISNGLNSINFPTAASATAEYNDLVSKHDSAQAALAECQGA